MSADTVATVGPAYTARQEICEMGRRIYARAFVAANDGNISARLGPDRILCTPTGVSKGFLQEEMLAICDMDGTQVSGPMKISSEIRMHLEAYKLRSDIAAVVHAHPPCFLGVCRWRRTARPAAPTSSSRCAPSSSSTTPC
jgi:L-fuculose-phosphate aldolase